MNNLSFTCSLVRSITRVSSTCLHVVVIIADRFQFVFYVPLLISFVQAAKICLQPTLPQILLHMYCSNCDGKCKDVQGNIISFVNIEV